MHVRVQQRNGRKSLTTVQGLKKEFNYNKILKDLKKEFCCNGVVVQDPELGQVIQLQGDQRKNVSNFLVQVCTQSDAVAILRFMIAFTVRSCVVLFDSFCSSDYHVDISGVSVACSFRDGVSTV